jgi:nucleotide-binding universal stress UspA family protein
VRALIATDGSLASVEAARRAGELLRGDAEFVVATVVGPVEGPEADAGGFEGPLLSPDEARDLQRAAVVEAHAALAATAQVLGPAPVAQRIAEGAAGPAICSLATEIHADVIVVGNSGKGPLARALLGSVSSYVVHHCGRPVLVVPGADRGPSA